MNYLNLPNQSKIYVDLRIQEGSLGREFRLSGVAKKLTLPSKWIDKTEKHHWIYTFRYIGTDCFFCVEIDYNDKFISKYTI